MDANASASASSVVADPLTHDTNTPPTIAQAPFDNEDGDADLILRSSDKVDFYVHRLLLRKASSIFADMFTVGQAAQANLPDELPVVDVEESSSTIDSLLRICYPVDEVKETSLDKVVEVLKAALKYEMRKATTNMKRELLTYITVDPRSVYSTACSLNLEHEASQAAEQWRRQYDSLELQQHCDSCGHLVQWQSNRSGWQRCHNCGTSLIIHAHTTFSSSVGGMTYHQDVMQQNTAGHLHRLIQFVTSGIPTTFCSAPSQAVLNANDSPLLSNNLRDEYPFTSFPGSDLTIRSIDHLDIPTHTSVLIYASASTVLEKKEPDSSVIHLEEDGRTLATLLQLCYPYADFEVTPDACSVSLIARVRKTAEKYGMSNAARAAQNILSEQINDHPLTVFFLASQYGWSQDAELAATRCSALSWNKIEGPGSYTKEMEVVSAEVYYNLLKRWYEGHGASSYDKRWHGCHHSSQD